MQAVFPRTFTCTCTSTGSKKEKPHLFPKSFAGELLKKTRAVKYLFTKYFYMYHKYRSGTPTSKIIKKKFERTVQVTVVARVPKLND